MSLNGSGVFSVNSAGQPVVSGTLITAATFNAAMQDIATALSTALYKDGQQLNAANQAMGGFKLTGLAAGSTAGDSVRYEQVLLLAGGNMTGGLNGKLTTVASHATTADIFATTVGNLIDWTGTATTTAFAAAPQAGAERTLICAAAAVFTAGANMLIDGVVSGLNYTCAAGDKVIVRAVTTTQFRLTVQPYSATTENISMVRCNTCNGNGGTNTAIRRFTTQQTNQGVDITYADSAANGALFTINTPGVYSISYSDSFSAAAAFGITLDATGADLTTTVVNISAAKLLIIAETTGANVRGAVAWTGFIPAGSLIRPHTGLGPPGNGITTTNTQFTITKVA
jgi:hypothetical protein